MVPTCAESHRDIEKEKWSSYLKRGSVTQICIASSSIDQDMEILGT